MTETTKFVILGTQRTGTTLIRTSLDSHPDILCCGEVFNLGRKPYRNDDGYWKYSRSNVYQRIRSGLTPRKVTSEYLQQLYAKQPYSAVGFKFMLSHSIAKPYILQILLQHKVKAILVIRRNALKTMISRKVAAASGVYHVSRTLSARSAVQKWSGQKIQLDCDSLLTDLRDIVAEADIWRSLVGQSLELRELVYEEYLQDQDEESRQLQYFLDLDPKPLKSDLKKVNPDKLDQLIINFEEVQRTLQSTEFGEFLDA